MFLFTRWFSILPKESKIEYRKKNVPPLEWEDFLEALDD